MCPGVGRAQRRHGGQRADHVAHRTQSDREDAIRRGRRHERVLAAGEIIKRELSIPLTVLTETAQEILREGGQGIRRLLANLLMPEWPEGTRRALGFQFAAAPVSAQRASDQLAVLREADGENFSDED